MPDPFDCKNFDGKVANACGRFLFRKESSTARFRIKIYGRLFFSIGIQYAVEAPVIQ